MRSTDRLGRDLRDILNTIHCFSETSVAIHFVSQSLKTLDEEGKENLVSRLVISVLGLVGEMHRKQGRCPEVSVQRAKQKSIRVFKKRLQRC